MSGRPGTREATRVPQRPTPIAASGDAREGDLSPWIAWLVCVALIAGLGAYLATTLAELEYFELRDEGWYQRYAEAVSTRGLGAFPDLFQRYITDPSAHVFPNPLRVLGIAVSGAWCSVFGASFAALSWLSLTAHLLLVLACFVAARRYFGEAQALALAASLAFSPLLCGLARRALMDSFVTLTLAVAAWSFLAFALAPRERAKGVLCAVALLVALLAKETNVLFLVPFGTFLLWRAFGRAADVPWGTCALVLGLPSFLAGAVFVAAAGGIDPLLATPRIVLAAAESNQYAIRYGSGPWFRYLLDYLVLSPWVTLAALMGLGAFWVGAPRRGSDALEFFVWFAVLVLAVFAFFTKNVRYLAILELPLRILAITSTFVVLERFGRRRALWGGLALCALCCASDFATFQHLFVDNELYDPVSAALLGLQEIVPYKAR